MITILSDRLTTWPKLPFELLTPFPPPPECWDYSYALSCLDNSNFSGKILFTFECLSVSIAVIKHHDQNHFSEQRVYFILWLLLCHPGSQGRISKREPGDKN